MTFNLEEFKAGREAITRDGRRARFVGLVDEVRYGLVVLIEDSPSCIVKLHKSGSKDLVCATGLDLIRMAPKRRELWARAYREVGVKGRENIIKSCSIEFFETQPNFPSSRQFEWMPGSEPVLVHSWEEE